MNNVRKSKSFMRLTVGLFFAVAFLYALVAYVVMPAYWDKATRDRPKLDDQPGITQTANGIPGDPINLAVIATKPQLMSAMVKALWYPANPLTFESCLEIAEATVLKRPYDEAPVSSLYYYGRKEDLAFERPVGNDPRRRHHVRFWQSDKLSKDLLPIWMGSATYDIKVGLSDTTGQFTHHISPEIDDDRNLVVKDLESTGEVIDSYKIKDFHKVHAGKNGEGDPWKTDGALSVVVF